MSLSVLFCVLSVDNPTKLNQKRIKQQSAKYIFCWLGEIRSAAQIFLTAKVLEVGELFNCYLLARFHCCIKRPCHVLLPSHLYSHRRKHMTWGGAKRGKYHFLSSRVDQMLTERFEESTPGDNNYCISAAQRVTEGTYSHVWWRGRLNNTEPCEPKASSKTSSNPGDKRQNHV